MYTEEINKIALSSSDDKRLQIFDKITSYSYVQMLQEYAKQSYWMRLLQLLKYKMINFDDVAKKQIKKQNKVQIDHKFWPSIENINNWIFWIKKNKYVIKFNEPSIRYS